MPCLQSLPQMSAVCQVFVLRAMCVFFLFWSMFPATHDGGLWA